MGFNCGLVGLPNVGKSTIFNALTAAGAKVESFPFSTIKTNVGVVAVPDQRLDKLATLYPEKRKVPTTLEFLDIAGLVRGAHQGEGLGNQFLAEIRNVDAIAHIVRCFEDPNVAHVDGSLDPKRDIEVVELELLLKDLETLENALDKLRRRARAGEREAQKELALLERIAAAVKEGKAVRTLKLTEEEAARLRGLGLLTEKPVLFVANVGDEGENDYSKVVAEAARARGAGYLAIRGRLEMEIVEATEDEAERALWRREWGLAESGLERLIRAGYQLLDLVTFFTTDGPEVRAWTVKRGTKAPQAGAKIHTDFEKRFIQAEVIPIELLLEKGSLQAVKEAGGLTRAGESYEVQDGDVIHFIVA
ncbi:MAG: redox-regulated ATPase YchF, partial [Candidatus Bipolaricaulia bacterium]